MRTFECRDEHCLSALTLDQYVLSELDTFERSAADRVLADCEGCQARLEDARAGFAALPSADPNAMLAAIKSSVDEGEMPADLRVALKAGEGKSAEEVPPSWGQRLFEWLQARPLSGLAAIAVPLVAVALIMPGVFEQDPTDDTTREPPGVRLKGSIGFKVYRVESGQRLLMMSGERFASGDELIYEVSLSKAGHVLIVGDEPGEPLYASYPSDTQGQSMPIGAGTAQLMESSVILESVQNQERLYAVFCNEPFALSQIERELETIRVPESCSKSGFVMAIE